MRMTGQRIQKKLKARKAHIHNIDHFKHKSDKK